MYVKKDKQLKKIKKNLYFNKMKYKIDNIMYDVLKNEHLKKKN